jgi:hypothetical protein
VLSPTQVANDGEPYTITFLILTNHDTAEVLSRVHVGPEAKGSAADMTGAIEQALIKHYNREEPRVRHTLDPNASRSLSFLNRHMQYFDHVLLDGRRLVPSSRSRSQHLGNSLVKAVFSKGSEYVGVVDSIFRHEQYGIHDPTTWAEMRWMKHLPLTAVVGDPWSEL